MVKIPKRYLSPDELEPEVLTEDDAIEALPPKLKRAYLQTLEERASEAAAQYASWRDFPRWKRVAWWTALPFAFLLACCSVVLGAVLMVTFVLFPIGLYIMFAGTMPFAFLLTWRIKVANHIN